MHDMDYCCYVFGLVLVLNFAKVSSKPCLLLVIVFFCFYKQWLYLMLHSGLEGDQGLSAAT